MRAIELWVIEYAMNALWQVPLVFAAAWLAARLSRRNGPAMQHRIWVTALLLEAVLPACELPLQQWWQTAIAAMRSASHTPGGASVTVSTSAGIVHGGLQMAPIGLTIAATLYACALLYFALRLAVGLDRTTALRNSAQPASLDGSLGERCDRCARIFGVPNAIIAISSDIPGPLTLGVRHRILMLPTGIETTVVGEDLEAAIAHEFAHMQRWDFAKNLLYQAISLPIALHPFLWVTRQCVAETREIVCDALAAEAVHGRERYARSLLRLATTFSAATQFAHIHAIGIFDANHAENFERRVMNLTEKRVDIRGVRRAATVAACTALGFGACASALALRMQVAPQNATQPITVTVAVPKPVTGEPVHQVAVEVASATAPTTATTRAAAKAAATTAVTTAAAETAATTAPARISVVTSTTVSNTQTSSSNATQVSSSIMVGNLLSKVTPVYPVEAKEQKIQGAVVLDAVIGKDGTIKSLKLVSGPEQLTKSAWDAVKQWTYKPYLLNGNPTEVETTITVHYNLAN